MKLRKDLLRTPEFAAALAALCYGLLVHSFAFFNILNNYDNIAAQPGGYGIGSTLGRWMLDILGLTASKLGLDYNLPVVNGVLYILLIALTAASVVSVLRLRSRVSAVLIGMLFAAFPTVTATMIYRYTVVFYGISALLAVLAVGVSRRWRWGWLPGAVLLAASMGIYQAYVPLAIGLFVLLLLQAALRDNANAAKLIRQGLLDCVTLLFGLALYSLCLRLCRAIFGASLQDYQGVSNMFAISPRRLPGLIWDALTIVCRLPVQDAFGLANRAVMRLMYLALGAASLGMTGYLLAVKVKNWLTAAAVCVLLTLFPIAVNFITVMCPDAWVYTLMVYPFTLLTCLPLMLAECMPAAPSGFVRKLAAQFVALAAAVLVFYYGYYANVNYTALHFANRQIENYLNSLVTQVRMTEGFTPDKQWAFLGDIDDPLLESAWEEEAFYGGLGFTQYLLNQYSRPDWMENYIGYRVPMASEEDCQALAQQPEVQAMPCWPSQGSVAVIGDTVVIKFQELTP